jgi:hypothetical protein
MVMWDFRTNMVQDVCLRNSVGQSATKPPKERSSTTKQATIHSRKRPALEVEGSRPIVRKQWIGVLEEGDQNDPVVDPKIREEIYTGHFAEAAGDRPVDEGTEPEKNSNVAEDDLVALMRAKNYSPWIEVVGVFWIVALPSSIEEEVCGPTQQLFSAGWLEQVS